MAAPYGSVPQPNVAGYGHQDFASGSNPVMTSPLGHSAANHHHDNDDDDLYENSSAAGLNRSTSVSSTANAGLSRNNTLKKRSSVKRSASLKRSSSKRSLNAGSLKAFAGAESDDFHSFFYTPIPTTGAPTEILANRFQAWRQLLKSLITYFREIQNSYDTRAKALHKVQNTLSNISHPSVFMSDSGLADAARILDDYHKHSISEANKSRDIENDVIGALTGLRSDLGQKIKEIKSLSGDFKNSVDKEKDTTRREVEKLQEALQHANDEGGMGKNDPYVVRLGVDRAIEKQIDEENYLHRAYLNLESSGRELESIVVGEIQKAYNAYAGILKREGDDAYSAVEGLRSGPIAMPKDQEWTEFVTNDPHFVDPKIPLRRVEDISYPGKSNPAATEIRAGMLERKSKYLKSYTPGWYVLSPTHLHEFKSADKIYSQPPVMSLYLLDQKLGSRSEVGSSSHKFMLKGKQSGGMHKGHNWVFRAESYDTMMAWFEDIRILTEGSGEARNTFIRKHARSVSGTSDRGTVSSDGLEEDEADQVPYSADAASLAGQNPTELKPQRPQPGGRFPSDVALRKTGTLSDGADSSDVEDDVGALAAGAGAGALAGGALYRGKDPYHMEGIRSASGYTNNTAIDGVGEPSAADTTPVQTQSYALPVHSAQPVNQQQPAAGSAFLGGQPANNESLARTNSQNYGDWMAPAAIGAAAGAVGVGAIDNAHNANHVQPAKPVDAAVAPSGPVDNSVDVSNVAAIPLGGLEKRGAHETGQFFPQVLRHDTEISVRDLHVPGKFPPQSSKN